MLPFHHAPVASVPLSLTWPKMFPFPLFWRSPNSRYAPAYQSCFEMLQLMATFPVILLTVSNKQPRWLWPCWLLYRVAAALAGSWVHHPGSASTFIWIPGSRIRRPSLRLSFGLSIPLPILRWNQNHSSAFKDQNPSQLFSWAGFACAKHSRAWVFLHTVTWCFYQNTEKLICGCRSFVWVSLLFLYPWTKVWFQILCLLSYSQGCSLTQCLTYVQGDPAIGKCLTLIH